MYRIVKKERLASNVFSMEVEAPLVARKAKAGQFIILRIDDRGERIPLTIADYDRERGTIRIVVQEVGKTTKQLGRMEEGEYILDFVGPLGNPTHIESYGTVVCVGGGLGIAPIFPIARAMREAGNRVVSIIGARMKELLIMEEELSSVSDRLVIATDDGSYGMRGTVVDALRWLSGQEKIDLVIAIGPMIMMKFVTAMCVELKLPIIVSMNTIMVDGTGMCGCCRLTYDGQVKFACVDGPDFDGTKVDFNELLSKHDRFKRFEQQALELYEKKLHECQLKRP